MCVTVGFNIALCVTVGFNITLCVTIGFNIALRIAVGYNIALRIAVGFNIALCIAVGYNITLCITVGYNITLCITVGFNIGLCICIRFYKFYYCIYIYRQFAFDLCYSECIINACNLRYIFDIFVITVYLNACDRIAIIGDNRKVYLTVTCGIFFTCCRIA